MRLHRFYIDPNIHELTHDFWLHEPGLINQWKRVLRYRAGQEVILFDGFEHERLYKITELTDKEAHIQQVTDIVIKKPTKDIYLAWSLLKKDKNDWVIQKCTELGVNHFIPVLAERSEKTGFNEDRARRIITEASEQCGRGNIPSIREPLTLDVLISEFKDKLPIIVLDQSGKPVDRHIQKCLLIIGPEGGWSQAEMDQLKQAEANIVSLGDFTHRAETASVAAASKLL